MDTIKRKYGYIRSSLDHRDAAYQIKQLGPMEVPPSATSTPYDLRPKCPPVYDQLKTGSCVAQAAVFLAHYNRIAQGMTPDFVPSRLYVYWNARSLTNDTGNDDGSQPRNGLKALAQWGAPPETDWPFDSTKVTVKPVQAAYNDGLKDVAIQYSSVPQTLENICACLAFKEPVTFGMSVFAAFESDEVAATGDVPMPGATEKDIGGHAVAIVGTVPSQNRFIFRNSWGTGWGASGYGTIPYDYVLNPDLADDFWVLRLLKKHSI